MTVNVEMVNSNGDNPQVDRTDPDRLFTPRSRRDKSFFWASVLNKSPADDVKVEEVKGHKDDPSEVVVWDDNLYDPGSSRSIPS